MEFVTKNMERIAEHYSLSKNAVRAIFDRMRGKSEDAIKDAIERAAAAAWSEKLIARYRKGATASDFARDGKGHKAQQTSASTTSTAQKQAAVIKALAGRFGVSEAEFKAAVLRYGSIAKALEARQVKAWGYDTVERSLFPTAQKGLHPLSPAAMFGRNQDTTSAADRASKDARLERLLTDAIDSIEAVSGYLRHDQDTRDLLASLAERLLDLVEGAKAKQTTVESQLSVKDVSIDWFYGDMKIPKKRG